MNTVISQRGFRVLVVGVLATLASFASAQVVSSGNASSTNPALLPDLGNLQLAQAQLTPEQIQEVARLRYLQSRRRGQVRTGIPQFIPFGPGAMMPPGNMQMDDQGADSSRKSSTQKRIEARKVRDEQKKAARDEAVAKKAKKAKPDTKDAAKAKKAKADVAKKKSA